MKHPFADAIQFCLQENLPITSELYERFRRSDEFGALLESSNGFRGFLFLPGTKLLVKQVGL